MPRKSAKHSPNNGSEGTAELHLGEGTGAVASLPLWDMALAVYNGCYSFAEGGITPYIPQC